MNNTLKYKIDTAEIIAFIIGVFLILISARLFFNDNFFVTDFSRIIVVSVIVTFFASLYGAVTGGLTGFLGYISAMTLCGFPIKYGDAFSIALLGIMIGQFANRYYIREGDFTIKRAVVWFATNAMSVIAVYVFEKPFVDFIIYNMDLSETILNGINMFKICAFPVGGALTVLIYIISKISRYVKS